MVAFADTYGPIQFKKALGWTGWQMDRGFAEAILPGPDFGGRRWTRQVVEGVLARQAELRETLGTVPDCEAWPAAQVLAGRFGGDVQADAVVELARQGRLREAGNFKGRTLYSGRDIEAFTDTGVYMQACLEGRQRTREQVRVYLRVRDVDVDHLLRAGLLRAVASAPGRWGTQIALFRTGDLDALLAGDQVDWPAVRATPLGKPSPLAKLPAAA